MQRCAWLGGATTSGSILPNGKKESSLKCHSLCRVDPCAALCTEILRQSLVLHSSQLSRTSHWSLATLYSKPYTPNHENWIQVDMTTHNAACISGALYFDRTQQRIQGGGDFVGGQFFVWDILCLKLTAKFTIQILGVSANFPRLL